MMGARTAPPQGEFAGIPAPAANKKPRGTNPCAGRENKTAQAYFFAKTCLATWALARLAAFLWTTPDFTALSIAEV